MSLYVTETHPLIWYKSGKHSALSAKVTQIFQQAEKSEVLIYVPVVILWEIALLEKRGKIKLSQSFEQWSAKLLSKNGFALAQLETEIIAKAVGYNFNDDPFDGIIVATARRFDLPLITKDAAIAASNIIEIFW